MLRRVPKPRKADVYKYSNVKIPLAKIPQDLGIDQDIEQVTYIYNPVLNQKEILKFYITYIHICS